MKFIITNSWQWITILFSLAIVFISNGCTVVGFAIGQSKDKQKSLVDQTWSIDQLDSIMIGNQIEVHSKSGITVKGSYLGSETFAYDTSISLLLVKRGAHISRIKHSTIGEIRVYAEKKNDAWILGLIGAAVDLTISTIFLTSFSLFHGPIIF
jgi:hypothetical protein